MTLAADTSFLQVASEKEPLQHGLAGRIALSAVERREEDRLICAFLEWLLPKSSGDRLASSHRQEEARRCRFDDFWALFKADGSLDWPDFEQFVRWESRFAGSARRLFDLLDDTGSGRISARTVLQARREFERSTDVRHSNLEDLKKVLLHLHGNLGRAWRKEFDLEQTGKCCQSVFVKACRAVGFQGDLRSTWAELTDGEVHRQATLRDLDPQADELMVRFVHALKRWHNTARDGWFAVMKAHGSHGRMYFSEFVTVGARLGFGEKELKKIFNCLDANLDRRVSLSEWLFLELWESRPAADSPGSSRAPSAGPGSARRQTPVLAASASAASLGSSARPPLSARTAAASPGGEEGLTEFVVVLTKEEYEEYQRRLRQRYGRTSRVASSAHMPSTPGKSQASHLSTEAWSAAALDSPTFGHEVT